MGKDSERCLDGMRMDRSPLKEFTRTMYLLGIISTGPQMAKRVSNWFGRMDDSGMGKNKGVEAAETALTMVDVLGNI